MPDVVACSQDNAVAFGADLSILLYQLQSPDDGKSPGVVTSCLRGHQGRINCVRWFDTRNAAPEANSEMSYVLLSSAVDATAIVWLPHPTNASWSIGSVLKGHTGSVTAIEGGVYGAHVLVVTIAADSTICIWSPSTPCSQLPADISAVQKIDLHGGIAMAVALSLIPGTSVPVLAYGGDDTLVHINVWRGTQFEEVAALAGHEDWVRSLDFASFPAQQGNDLLLASAGQDSFIRLWRLTQNMSFASQNGDESLSRAALKTSQRSFIVKVDDKPQTFLVVLDALLIGHDERVYSVQWHPKIHNFQPARLLSSSLDKTMVMWRPDAESGVWIEDMRVGEVGGNNTSALYGAVFNSDGSLLLGHGYQGAFHLWRRQGVLPSSVTPEVFDEAKFRWEPSVTVSGHFAAVYDFDWDPSGIFLISCSDDQTTRIYAQWKRDGVAPTWHEMARPQIHGYDMRCVASITPSLFVSGAEEKVLRVFAAPGTFVETMNRLCGGSFVSDASHAPLGATVPVLGLSNKAVFEEGLSSLKVRGIEDSVFDREGALAAFVPMHLEHPPYEEHLLQNTLWPEVHKLYGHGYELVCVAANHCGSAFASSCKATQPEHAMIRIWSTREWRELYSLPGHKLTVTQLSFSHNDQWLLSASRDRHFCLYRAASNTVATDPLYVLHSTVEAHERIIWSISWSHDDKFFATASRDKLVKIWEIASDDSVNNVAIVKCNESVTAVDFSPRLHDASYCISVGLDNGDISLWNFCASSKSATFHTAVDTNLTNTSTVRRLRFRPLQASSDNLQLGSCSTDHSVRIFNLPF